MGDEIMKNEIILFENQNVKLEVNMKDETVWLTQEQMGTLFGKSKSTINEHIKNIYREKELEEQETLRKFGNSEFSAKPINYYNLDMIISVGYRVNSKNGIIFRKWATKILKDYMIKGFALNDERFINGNKFGIKYFDELLERIKTIRVSERMAYQKIMDLFIATSLDYNPKAEEAYTFFKIVQDKLHYAISCHTAAELIYARVNANKENMGLTNWKNSPNGLIYKYDFL